MPDPAPITLGLVERVAALHRVDLFAEVPGRVLAAVADVATEVRAAAGESLIEEGAVEAHLYAVVDGRVRVHRGDQTLVELGPGTTVGELAALVPAAAHGVGDCARADARAARSTRRCSTIFSPTGPSSHTA